MLRRAVLLSSLVPVLVLSVHACGSSGGSSSHGTGGQSSTGTNTGGADASDDGLFTDHGPIVSIAVDPPSATIDILNGAITTQQFTAIATFQDNTTAMVDADWTFDHPVIGLI